MRVQRLPKRLLLQHLLPVFKCRVGDLLNRDKIEVREAAEVQLQDVVQEALEAQDAVQVQVETVEVDTKVTATIQTTEGVATLEADRLHFHRLLVVVLIHSVVGKITVVVLAVVAENTVEETSAVEKWSAESVSQVAESWTRMSRIGTHEWRLMMTWVVVVAGGRRRSGRFRQKHLYQKLQRES